MNESNYFLLIFEAIISLFLLIAVLIYYFFNKREGYDERAKIIRLEPLWNFFSFNIIGYSLIRLADQLLSFNYLTYKILIDALYLVTISCFIVQLFVNKKKFS